MIDYQEFSKKLQNENFVTDIKNRLGNGNKHPHLNFFNPDNRWLSKCDELSGLMPIGEGFIKFIKLSHEFNFSDYENENEIIESVERFVSDYVKDKILFILPKLTIEADKDEGERGFWRRMKMPIKRVEYNKKDKKGLLFVLGSEVEATDDNFEHSECPILKHTIPSESKNSWVLAKNSFLVDFLINQTSFNTNRSDEVESLYMRIHLIIHPVGFHEWNESFVPLQSEKQKIGKLEISSKSS